MTTPKFRFNDNVRPIVANLANMLKWANNQDHDDCDGRPIYASQRNLYGHFSNALKAIITEECGCDIYNAIDNSKDGFNFGGNATWLDDIECAVDYAYADLKAAFERESFYSRMFKQYVETAFWSSTDSSDNDDRSFEYHNYDIDDLSECAKQSMWDDCVAFADETESYRGEITADDMGHNFWLNRNGHGAGFWDMDYSYADGTDDHTGRKLSDASKVWGSSDIYRGDDGVIYVS